MPIRKHDALPLLALGLVLAVMGWVVVVQFGQSARQARQATELGRQATELLRQNAQLRAEADVAASERRRIESSVATAIIHHQVSQLILRRIEAKLGRIGRGEGLGEVGVGPESAP